MLVMKRELYETTGIWIGNTENGEKIVYNVQTGDFEIWNNPTLYSFGLVNHELYEYLLEKYKKRRQT